MKGEDDPYTIADVKAQTLIINGLKKFWFFYVLFNFIKALTQNNWRRIIKL